jgi:PAS domain-containing protein
MASALIGSQSYSIGEVAMMIGVSTHTIRAWEKRHGLVSGDRPAGQMRRYSLDDVEVLRQVKVGRMVRGFSVKLAVQWAMGLLPDSTDEPAGRGSLASVPRPPLRVDGDGGPWRAIVDALPHLVFIVDAAGRLADVNVNAAKVAGTTRERLRGRPFSELVDPYDRAKAVAACRPPFPSRRRWEVNMRTHNGPGTFAFDCWPIRWQDQTLLVLLGTRAGAA